MKPTRSAAVIAAAVVVASVALAAPATAAPPTAAAAAEHLPRISGTAWVVDQATSQLVVTYDRTVTGAKHRHLAAAARRYGDVVRLESTGGTLLPYISGGQPIFSAGFRCTLGFNVESSSGADYFVTAGHCTQIAARWYADPGLTVYLGTAAGSSFPGNDYGVVRYDSTVARPGNVYLQSPGGYRDITSARNATVGEAVCYSSPVQGVHCGTVLAVNATVNYPQGTVTGMIVTNICTAPGDSGAPLFAGGAALGTLSGGSGNCTTGGRSYFQPITEVLSAYGLRIY